MSQKQEYLKFMENLTEVSAPFYLEKVKNLLKNYLTNLKSKQKKILDLVNSPKIGKKILKNYAIR